MRRTEGLRGGDKQEVHYGGGRGRREWKRDGIRCSVHRNYVLENIFSSNNRKYNHNDRQVKLAKTE